MCTCTSLPFFLRILSKSGLASSLLHFVLLLHVRMLIVLDSNSTCCPTPGLACGPSQSCCGSSGCCPSGSSCCTGSGATKCCDNSFYQCCGGVCCPLQRACCGDVCCDAGWACESRGKCVLKTSTVVSKTTTTASATAAGTRIAGAQGTDAAVLNGSQGWGVLGLLALGLV